MLNVKAKNPFASAGQAADPLPHFAPFFLDKEILGHWTRANARRAEANNLFSAPNTGFHHNPMESDVSYLYLATSPNYPDEVKIGMTGNRPDKRLKNAGTDIAFRKDPNVEIKAFFMIKNARAVDVESATHKLLETFRSDPIMRRERVEQTGEKEWFSISIEEALSAIELASRNYDDPKKINRLSRLITSGLHDLDKILFLDDTIPDFFDTEFEFSEKAKVQDSIKFNDLFGTSLYNFNKNLGKLQTDIVIVQIRNPPEDYFWDFAQWLIPQREALMGNDQRDFYAVDLEQKLISLDMSIPENQPFLRNGFVAGTIGDGYFVGSRDSYEKIDLDLSFKKGSGGSVNRYTDLLYRTDLVNSPLMERITALYNEVRNRIDEALPQFDQILPNDQFCRNTYIHKLSSSVLRATHDNLTPHVAQILNTAAYLGSGTPIDMCICPVELCEIVKPLLREYGRSAETAQESPSAA